MEVEDLGVAIVRQPAVSPRILSAKLTSKDHHEAMGQLSEASGQGSGGTA